MYAGYELYEHVAVRPGSEEYLDSEKYQIRIRDWEGAEREGRSLAPYVTMVNRVRREHRALQLLRNLTVHNAEDDSIVTFSKTAFDHDGRPTDTVIAVVNVDPHNTRETTVHLDLTAMGMQWDDRFVVRDEVTGAEWTWGAHNYVRLDPFHEPAHILTVRSTHPR
jgi:starch synthase (maltosyl-transferring)